MPQGQNNAPSHGAHKTSHASTGDGSESARFAHSDHMDHGTRGSGEAKAELETSRPNNHHAPEGSHEGHGEEGCHHHHQHGSSERPMFATITVAVCHCGAGCVLGDIVGEWLIYGTGAAINGRALWVEYLIGKQPLPILS